MTASTTQFDVRAAIGSDIPVLARIWFDGWHKAHDDTLPAELRQYRTEASFTERLRAGLADVRVLVRDGVPVGFGLLRGNEINQFYVALDLIGSGAAAALMADAEASLQARGFQVGILNCAVGNDRAVRFYEKSGWHSAGLVDIQVDAGGRRFPLTALRFEKRL
ncbi:MAG: GNAT family N-acetyltransferase [Asticcacaulis sp.]|nr:GNAT family N-acetyltransferase [Asticcacaulis sp.]